MTCIDREPGIALYVEGDLPAREAPVLEAHLAECAACREFAAALRESQAAVKELGNDAADPAVLAAIRARVMAELAVPRARRWAWARLWVAAAACAAVVVAALLFPRGAHELPPPPPRPVAAVPAAPRLAASRQAPHRVRPAVRAVPRRASRPAAPLLMQIVTDDPNVVIYWIVEDKERGE